ncbi:MAG: hypothetical protein K2X01_00835 [Cyanobacteria bacterium]|nr:hypothetical protein [Cyanobacteriota bacterium]
MAKAKIPTTAKNVLTPDQIILVETSMLEAIDVWITDWVKQAGTEETFHPLAVQFERELGYWYLRLFIERGDGHIALSDCEVISRFLDEPVDAQMVSLLASFSIKELPYSFEVSSPGLFRELKTSRELEFFLGEPVEVSREVASESKNTVKKNEIPERILLATGILEGYQPGAVIIRTDSGDLATFNPQEPGLSIRLNPTIEENPLFLSKESDNYD